MNAAIANVLVYTGDPFNMTGDAETSVAQKSIASRAIQKFERGKRSTLPM